MAFALDPGAKAEIDPCLTEMASTLLPVCEQVASIQRFVETRSSYRYPLVFHAVAGAMRGILSEWLLLMARMEHLLRKGQLNLQALIYHCQVRHDMT